MFKVLPPTDGLETDPKEATFITYNGITGLFGNAGAAINLNDLADSVERVREAVHRLIPPELCLCDGLEAYSRNPGVQS